MNQMHRGPPKKHRGDSSLVCRYFLPLVDGGGEGDVPLVHSKASLPSSVSRQLVRCMSGFRGLLQLTPRWMRGCLRHLSRRVIKIRRRVKVKQDGERCMV